ncbi:FAD-binding oxidoreductase [Hydrogenophaga sp. 2FB]|uniref:FAD-binding oxidoreductase n=1 Tax=Hydrogenophaga sp. 2FB TaxID=2502187 RepID=UPI0010F5F0F8|nr:FAD-binding oxidoreductase [Hydrogenophaga sp. 2FB]
MTTTASSFVVRVLPIGMDLNTAHNVSILEAGLHGGISIPHSCRTGLCGTCKGELLSGQVRGRLADGDCEEETDASAGDMILLCKSTPLSDCAIRVPQAKRTEFRPQRLPARIVSVQRLATDVVRLALRLPMNRPIEFLAGQYLEILLKDGQRRSFSIASSPAVGGKVDIELHVRHHPGGLFSDPLFSTTPTSGVLQMEGPFGSFQLREPDAGPTIFLATGTGFAPVKAMVEEAIGTQRTARQAFHVYWGGRVEADLYDLARVRAWANEGHITFHPVLSRAKDADWTGRQGHVQNALMEDFNDLRDATVYACGSEAMVSAARDSLVSVRNLAKERFFADAFFSAQANENARTSAGATPSPAESAGHTAGRTDAPWPSAIAAAPVSAA